jgi:hypothetical protein
MSRKPHYPRICRSGTDSQVRLKSLLNPDTRRALREKSQPSNFKFQTHGYCKYPLTEAITKTTAPQAGEVIL